MTTLATLLVKVGVDASDVDKQTEGISQKFSKVGRTMTATVTPAVAGLGVVAVNAASDLEESINAIEVVFGPAADQIKAFGETAEDTVGLSQRAFNELVTPVGAALQNVGFSADEAADASVNLAERAADMASVFNTDVDDALGAIQAGLRGEADPLERFGVGLSAAAVEAKAMELGLADAEGELSNNAKAQARLALLMEQTDDIAGDFANTSGSVANQERIAAAEAENMAAKFGQELIPIKQQLIGVLRTVLSAFNSLSPGMRRAIVIAAGVAAAIGPVILVAGSLARAGMALIPVFKAVGTAFMVLSRILLANPWVLVAAAIIALVVVVVKNWDTIKNAIATAWNFIKRITVKVWNAVVGFLKRNWKIILAAFTGPIGIIVALVANNWDAIRNHITRVMGIVRSAISRAWNAIRGIVSGAVNRVRSLVSRGFNRARQIAVRAVNMLRIGVSRAFSRVISFVRDIPGRILGFLSSLPRRMLNVGKNIIQGLIDGIGSMLGSLGGVMESAVGKVTNLWPFSPAKEGPLRRRPPELAGENIGTLFAGGMLGAEREVVAAAERIARAAALEPGVTMPGAFHQAHGTPVVEFRGDGSARADFLLEELRRAVDERGGDVQVVVGRGAS